MPVENRRNCNTPDFTTGYRDCANWDDTWTIPGSALPASGVYLARIRNSSTGEDNQVIFTVRDDQRHSELLYKLPTATYQAYNNFNGHSLYTFNSSGFETITGVGRAVKVSFDRPYANVYNAENWFLKADFPMVEWLEREGYEVDYTESTSINEDPGQLLNHNTLVLSGHDEYWSEAEMDGYKAARDAGVNIASFSGNTAYWKVRYEDGGRTLVCYKSIEGTNVVEGERLPDGTKGVNDWGPDGIKGTADDAVGADGIAGTSDDNPQYSTTTWRDNGAPPGNPNAPPEGRVGPDDPENSLLGAMYVGDNDNWSYPLTVPATNETDEFAGDRIWRNTGISESSSTTIGNNLTGWEWDSIPTQAQYTSREPAGVKRLTQTNMATAPSPANWVQDEGLIYSHSPPPGQPSTVSAVKYTAPSGALVFHAGTVQWSWGLAPHYLDQPGIDTYEDPPVDSSDSRIQQATYNILADMGVEPQTPAGILIDGNDPPTAAFTVTPNPTATGLEVHFDASGSSDSDGQIVKYEWDLDGNGSFETDTGGTPSASTTYSNAGEVTVRLRVTDGGGAADQATRTVVVSEGAPGNASPQASFAASPSPAPVGASVTFDASGSSDSDGEVVKYEWDLDGNGSYETDTGSDPTATHSYATEGAHHVGLRVTDNDGATNSTAKALIVGEGGTYFTRTAETSGLIHLWRLDEESGAMFADSVGSSPATIINGATLGASSPLTLEDGDTAASFDGVSNSAAAPIDLSTSSQITVEFWLKWNAYANDDRLAMELTPNFNNNGGGFLIDPDAPENGGKFGVGVGNGSSRNNAYFQRPSAGAWHHYAFVLDSTAPAAQQVIPYVDGQAVPFTKTASGTGAGAFAKSTLYFMSRAASSLFGAGTLDEVAIYDRALGAEEIAQQYDPNSNKFPTASFAASPDPVPAGSTVSFDASGSSDPDGEVVKYEWDLDGNGTYETDSGSNPTTTTSFATEGPHLVGLRVTDDEGATGTTTRTANVQGEAPTASFAASPNPASVGETVLLDASGSSDPDGQVVKYEWDLDGNGSYEVDTDTSPEAARAFSTPGEHQVGLRVTDDEGTTATTTRTVSVVGPYGTAVASTPGLIDYWRLGEQSGTDLTDRVGGHDATAQGGVALGAAGALQEDPDTAAAFDGTSAGAAAPIDLSASSQVTVEFWLKWNGYADDDRLAMELTPNFNNNGGGFLIDPNAPQAEGKFGVGIGQGASRNNAYFPRPSAGAWHHYAFVLDSAASADQQIIPYVDGRPVAFEKLDSGTGAGNFAKSTLYFMSRAASSLFGAGTLDEVAIYDRALGAEEIAQQYYANGADRPPTASFAASPNPAPSGQAVTFDASGSSDPDGQVVKYEWDLDGNGSYEVDTDTSPEAARAFSTPGEHQVGLRVTDDEGATATTTRTVTVQNRAPSASFTASPNPAPSGQAVTFDASGSSDPDGEVVKHEWDLNGDGSYETDGGAATTVSHSFESAGSHQVGLRVTDDEGATATAVLTVTAENRAPTASFAASPNPAPSGQAVTFDASGSSDPDGQVVKYEWDLDGNGSYEVDTDTSPEAARAFSTPGEHQVGLRVTDDEGTTATTTRTVSVVGPYGTAVASTPGLIDYWRLGEQSGTDLADRVGGHDATAQGGVALGAAGALQEDPDTAAAFDGTSAAAAAPIDLSASSQVTVEFWLKWNAYANDDRLAMELTPNFNNNGGGFLIDPNASAPAGSFGVAIGRNASRNNAYFARPSAGAWHHYAFVLDSAAPAAQQVVPYVDGQAVPFTKTASGTGAGNFAKSTLYFMSRAASSLFGAGTLDEVAIYDRALGAEEIAQQYYANGADRPPTASFAASPNPASVGETVLLDASGSSDPDGQVVKYEWDLDGNGSYEVDTDTSPEAARAFSTPGEHQVGLRVTDDEGTTATTTRTVTVTAPNQPPTASFTASPNPASVGEAVLLDASGSSDPDGEVVKYEWDLNGDGSYETDGGAGATTSHIFEGAGSHQVGLRVTDDEGTTATTTRTVSVVGPYGTAVASTPGLIDYWRLGEQSGTDLADRVGGHDATAQGGVALGAAGALQEDPDTAAAFDGTSAAAAAPIDLSASSQVTVEFWLKWNAYANDDRLAMELTPNFNNNGGGFLIDPNASAPAGSFGVAIGRNASRNNAYFARPDAGAWHHYAFVLDSAAPAAQQVVPYVDGQAVPFTKTASGTGAGNFAKSTLYFMSRAASSLFGAGTLDEVAIYDRALGAEEIAQQYYANGADRPPTASFAASPNPASVGETVLLDASGSSDPDGQVVKYEWDLDGNGSYEVDTDTSPEAARAFSTPGEHQVGLRVTDDEGTTATTTRTVTVTAPNQPPTASFTASPNPASVGEAVLLDASGSSDPDGEVVKYEWDLNGDGSYETDGGAGATTSHIFEGAGSHQVGLRVTDDEGTTATTTRTVSVVGPYGTAVASTPGLIDYWRLGEQSGTDLADRVGGHDATAQGGVALGAAGALQEDPDTAAAFDGTSAAAAAPIDLSTSSQVTVEFWLKWNAYANDDRLAMELTPNFNNNGGGFLIDPNASAPAGSFGVAIGRNASRNNAYFARPDAGAWHHYAFVLDSAAPEAQQVVPYVDGQAVPFTKTASGTGAGNFAKSTLYFMSRAASSLFGAGTLDEVAIYDRALGAEEIAQQYYANG